MTIRKTDVIAKLSMLRFPYLSLCSSLISKGRKKDIKKRSEVDLYDILTDVVFVPYPSVVRWFEIDNYENLPAAEKIFR